MAKIVVKKEKFEYGIRKISETDIYPVSIAFLGEFEEAVVALFTAAGETGDDGSNFVKAVYQEITKSLEKVMFASCGVENITQDMTLNQMADAVEKIAKLNFGDDLQKKIKVLFDKIPKAAVDKAKASLPQKKQS